MRSGGKYFFKNLICKNQQRYSEVLSSHVPFSFLLGDLFSQSGHGFLLLKGKKSEGKTGMSETAGEASVPQKEN